MSRNSTPFHRSVITVVVVALGVHWLAACATTTKPLPPVIDLTAAQVYSAELTAAQTFHETTLTVAGDEHRAGTLSDDNLARLIVAGDALVSSMRNYNAEIKLYLITGNDNTLSFNSARVNVAKDRLSLSLLWEAVHHDNTD